MLGLARDVAAEELAACREPAGCEHDRGVGGEPGEGLAQPGFAGEVDERPLDRRGVEPDARGALVAGAPLGDDGAERLEPLGVAVEPVEHQALKCRIPVRALLTEGLKARVAPHHAARQEHRSSWAVALLQEEDVGAAPARLGGRREPGHARSGHEEIGHLI